MNSLKKIMCANFTALSSLKEMEGNKVYFLTSFGMVSGRYSPNEPDENKICLSTLAKNFFNELSEDEKKASGNDGYILLKDVEISNGSLTFSFPEFMLFFDQIIGISFGTFKSED